MLWRYVTTHTIGQMRRAALAFYLLTAVVTACTGIAAKGTGEAAVTRFHQQLDSGSFDAIYDETDSLFQGASTREQFAAVLRAVHSKLGNVAGANETEFFTREEVGTNPGSYISLTFETAFASGKGTEKFNYRVDGGKVRLVGYNINSNELLTK